MFKAGIITISDSASIGTRIDESGLLMKNILKNHGYEIINQSIIPDDENKIIKEIKYLCDELKVNLILTSGGTGFSARDVTPEATARVIDKLAPGISESMRLHSLKITKRAMLSRGVSGIRNKTLIVNLPGSPKAVRECLEYIIDSLDHGLDILLGRTSNCAG